MSQHSTKKIVAELSGGKPTSQTFQPVQTDPLASVKKEEAQRLKQQRLERKGKGIFDTSKQHGYGNPTTAKVPRTRPGGFR